MRARTFKSRLHVCGVIAALPVVILSGRLVYLQAVQHKVLSGAASREFNRQIAKMGRRGGIFDRSGCVLARSLPAWSCYMLKNEVGSQADAISRLAQALGLPRSELEKKWRLSRNFFWVKRKLSPRTARKVRELKLKGVSLALEQARRYPAADIARGLLGTVGAEGYGLSGIESLYDRVLSGVMKKRDVIRDGKGRIIYSQEFKNDGAAPDIYLTLDRNIQFFSQQVIRRAVEKSRADLGMAIVHDPRNGDILALASYPQDRLKTPPLQLVFEPGSTFKLVTIAAALERGAVGISDEFDCENGNWALTPKTVIHDHEPEGILTVPRIIERSSNIGSAKIALKTGIDDFYSHVRAFGFGTKTGLGFPGESKGIVRPARLWKPVDLASAGYGYGIAVTGIQLVNAYSAIANNGLLTEPRLVRKIVDRNGDVLFASKPLKIRRVVSADTAVLMREMLKTAVDSGTGMQARIRSYNVAGKTGTSKKLDASGKYSSGEYVASFCGFVPANRPRFTILVILDNPRVTYYGGESAAPAFAELARRLLALKGIPPDRLRGPQRDAPGGRQARLEAGKN